MKLKIFLSIIILALSIDQSWASPRKELVVKTINGKIFDLSAQKNKVVLVLYWASWCGVCQVEIVQLDKIYKKYHSQGLEIIGLNLDGEVGDAKDLSYPIAISDDATINDFPNPPTIPTVYIVDKKGVSRKFHKAEEVAVENLEKVILGLLE
jgi:thiol-disulfide isomerase/thioredoxin